MDNKKKVEKKTVPVLPWMGNPVDVSHFEACRLNDIPFLEPRLEAALWTMGFTSLVPVQVAVWQETIGPGSFEPDLCINSPTGSGKTESYAFPIVQSLSTRAVKLLCALVVLPIRDLALQVKEVFTAIATTVGFSVGLAIGQSSIADEISELIKRPKLEVGICYDLEDISLGLQSSVDIVVATPGRLTEHITNTKGLTPQHLCYPVVDETDRLLRESYQSWLPTALQLTRSGNECVCLYVDNNLPSMFGYLKTIRRLYVNQSLTPLFGSPSASLCGEKCIVITSSMESTHRLCALLNLFGDLKIKIKEYSGLQCQFVRSKTLKEFRQGKLEVFVSYDMPAYIKTYIHRAGRTARAGLSGRCFTLLPKNEVKRFKKLLQKAGNNACSVYSVPSESIVTWLCIHF